MTSPVANSPSSSSVSVVVRVYVVSYLLLLLAFFFLYRFPSLPWLSFLPLLLISAVSFYRFFPQQQRSVRGYLRLISYLAVVEVYQIGLVQIISRIISSLIGIDLISQTRYSLLTPYIILVCIFARSDPYIPLSSIRAWLIHLSYDIPALFTIYIYSQVFHYPLNSLCTQISHNLLLGRIPFSSDVAVLKARGVTAVINLCRECRGPVTEYQQWGISQLRLPTVDMSPPSIQDLNAGVEFIAAQLRKNPNSIIFVHCKHGMSRSASLILSSLISTANLTAVEALQLIKAARPEVTTEILTYPVIQQFIAEEQKRLNSKERAPTDHHNKNMDNKVKPLQNPAEIAAEQQKEIEEGQEGIIHEIITKRPVI